MISRVHPVVLHCQEISTELVHRVMAEQVDSCRHESPHLPLLFLNASSVGVVEAKDDNKNVRQNLKYTHTLVNNHKLHGVMEKMSK